MDTVMIGLQAAIVTSAQGGNDLMGIPADGESFSAILAGTASALTDGGQTPVQLPAETQSPMADSFISGSVPLNGGMLTEALKNMEGLDKAIRDSLRMLLKRVIDSFKGSQDGTERKTDLFAVIFVSKEDFGSFLTPIDLSDMDLLSAEILNGLGGEIEEYIPEDTEEPEVIEETLYKIVDGVVEVVSEILEDESDIDETIAEEAVAALMGVQDLESFALEAPAEEQILRIAEAFKAPMEAIRETAPERVPEAEKLYGDFAAEIMEASEVKVEADPKTVTEVQNVPETAATVKTGFAAYRVNNADGQIDAISEKTSEAEEITAAEMGSSGESGENVTDEKAVIPDNVTPAAAAEDADRRSELNAEAAAAAAAPVRTERTDVPEAEPVKEVSYKSADIQVREVIFEEISDMPEGDGVKELVLILRPKELGQVAVKLTKENGVLSVMLSAQYNEVGRMLSDRAAQLGNELQNGNVKVGSVNVVEPGSAAEQMGLNFTDRGFAFSGNQSGSGSGSYSGSDSAEEQETENIEIIREVRTWSTIA